MKKESFKNKYKNLDISESELDRKWRALKEEEESQLLFEAMQSTAMGGGSITPLLFIEIVPSNDFYYTFLSLFTEITPDNDIFYTFA